MGALNPGNTKIILFDESSKKYSVMKNVQIEKSDRIIGRLSEIFSPGNVVVH
jgi:hypothetical protein